jgi:hypothetical protein
MGRFRRGPSNRARARAYPARFARRPLSPRRAFPPRSAPSFLPRAADTIPPMRSLSSMVPSLSLLLVGASLAACGGGSTGGGSKAGLILGRSLFDADSNPQPSAMLLARPGAPGEPWTIETVMEPAQKISPQLGVAPDGSRVLRDVGGDGAVYKLAHADNGWTKGPVDVDPDEVVWDERDGQPSTKDYELGGGNVFHKAMWFEPAFGEPGILTISANAAFLKIWRDEGGTWTPEVLWTQTVGEKEHRFRDVEAGDVDGDGQDELVIVTHDDGKVFVLEQTAEGMQAQEVTYTENRIDGRIFVHEVEVGQFDDDPALEFCTTPSEPNKFDGEPQRGQVDLWDYDGSGGYTRRVVLDSVKTHAKEILATDLDGDGRDELYVAVEGEALGDGGGGGKGNVTRFLIDGDSIGEGEVIHELPGPMCRFLNAGDTDGDGKREIIASTRENGIRSIYLDGGTWKSRPVAPSFTSGGFEHATVVFDWDGDGIDEVFAASDPPSHARRLYRFSWLPEKGRYSNEELFKWPNSENYMTWMLQPLPAGH